MNRYIAFLDILGFSNLVEQETLASVKQRLHASLQAIALARAAGANPKEPLKVSKPFHYFSFSDTFVLASEDDSLEAFVPFLIGAALLSQYLFAQGLPVRGAITYGEADFVPGTNHLIGKGVIAAHALEKRQDWLGVAVDTDRIPRPVLAVFEFPLIAPLFARWNVPLKDGQTLENGLVVNWRLNLTVEKGTKSLFRPATDGNAQRKIENTLEFAKFIRDNNRHVGTARDENGNPIRVPFLAGCSVCSQDPSDPNSRIVHGDDW